MTDRTPIACTLSLGEYAKRLAWVAELNLSLRRYEWRGLVLELHYPAEEVARVQELVRQESSCCAFLQFEIDASPQITVLRIHAPEETRAVIETIFAPFLSGVTQPQHAHATNDPAHADLRTTRVAVELRAV